jgi:hypothetical protein
MLRQVLTSLAMISLHATTVGGDVQAPDIATWRWHVDGILDVQRAEPMVTVGAYDIGQQYQRFEPNGMPEAPTMNTR